MKKRILVLLVMSILSFMQINPVFTNLTVELTKDNTSSYKNIPLSSGDIGFCKRPNTYQSVYGGGRSSGTMFTVLGACVAQGHIYSASYYGPYAVGGDYRGQWLCGGNGCNATIRLNAEDYKGRDKTQVDYDYISVEGYALGGDAISSGNFNSPYIYLINPAKGNINVSIDSKLNKYTNTKPGFNIENGWNVDSKGEDTKLFYELAVNSVNLNRNGKNFSDREDLIDFLKTSEFFDKLGFTSAQKEDSLNYILPKIEEANNYYLTVLSSDSISNISELNISKTPEKIIRTYFAIYPSSLPISTSGDIRYPELTEDSGFIVRENGEIYIDNNMVIFWEK